ncbi:Magnesium transporter [uncultured Desulfobacterium sp.]|uniref:Magnesium transporter MgtE n=1 Tax=uncultured Desulfobacterium sp. TaxID=201089 RepID=A0A445MVD2_9BACT|nr:Magnesium transporter [uncultured Desulfobacterium sp.]
MALKTRTIDGKLVEDVRDYIEQGNENALKRLLDESRAADLADLIEHLKPNERIFIFKLLEPEGAGDVLVEIEPPVQEGIIKELDNRTITEIVQELDSDDAADVVGDLPAKRAKEVIEAVDDEVTEELEKLLPYPEDTAGGIMGLEFVAVKADVTLRDAIETIRAKKEEVENLYHIWVVDDFGKLVGLVSMKDFLLEPPHLKVHEIMNPEVISINALADQEEVVHLARKYDLVNIPVVDEHHRLIGRITHDDVIDVIEEEVDEDISLMAGVISEEVAEESTIKISKARLPWLLMAIFGELVAAFVITNFEASLKQIIALTFFFPVIMAMGGNSGTQAATIVVRGLATGDVSLVHAGRRLWREMRVALLNGLICGLVLGVIVGFWLSDPGLGLIVGMALILIIMNSGLIGASVPLVLKRFNIDPALGTGPFVSTSNDIFSLFIYLGLITVFLHSRF